MVRRAMGAEGFTAAEELALANHTKKVGVGAWEELSDMVRECMHMYNWDLRGNYPLC